MKDKKNNTGTDNTGEYNSGNRNSGNWNSGDRNSGNWNSGYWNSGYWNSGNWNSGNWNSGNWNSGYGNSGYGNSGDRNSGNWNSGYWNSGYGNSGYGNSGNWNSGDRNSGCFNTDEPKARMFNKECPYTLTELWNKGMMPDLSEMSPCVWIESSMMTADEKKTYPSHETTGGYLKTISYKEAWAVFWRKTSDANKQKVLALPNFNAEIFKEITGIDVEENSEAKKKAKQLREKAQVLLDEAASLESLL